MNDKPSNAGVNADADAATSPITIALFWLLTILPLAWGIYKTVLQAKQLLG